MSSNMYYGIRTTGFVIAGGMKEGRPGSELRNRDAFGVIGGETPLLLKLETQTNLNLSRVKRTGRSAKVAVE